MKTKITFNTATRKISALRFHRGFTKLGPSYQEKADKESWAAMKKFFGAVLGR